MDCLYEPGMLKHELRLRGLRHAQSSARCREDEREQPIGHRSLVLLSQ
jgi:hypothetical protein